MYIAIDIGSSFLKSAVIEIGKDRIDVIRSERKAVKRVCNTEPFEYEYDAELLMSEINKILMNVEKAPSGLLITTQMHGFILYDRKEDRYSNYISWQDERCLKTVNGESFLERLKRMIPHDIIELSGMRLKCEMALCNLYAMKEELGLDFKSGRYELFTLGSFIIKKLCGKNVTHITNAAPTGLFDLYNGCIPNNKLLHIVGFDGLILPKVMNSFKPCGELNGMPIYPDIGDQQVCIYAGSIECPSTISINIGTATQISRVADRWDDFSFEGPVEIRPFFDGKYLKTVSKLPGGRSLQVIADFFSDVVRTFSGKEISNPEIWQIIDSISVDFQTTLEVKTGFFKGLLFNDGKIDNIDARNLNASELASAAFADLARTYASMLPLLDPYKTAKKLVICGKFGENIKKQLCRLSDVGKYSIELSSDPENSFRGLGKLVQRSIK